LSEKLPVGSWVKIRTMKQDNNDDKFGRILGEFIIDGGINVNEWLIANNYAVPYMGENKDLVQEQHQTNKKILIERGELKE
jgi:endonuclease YncB( thermonuclease family)